MITPVAFFYLSGVILSKFHRISLICFPPSSKMRRGSDLCIICDAHLRRDTVHGMSSFDHNIDELLGVSTHT